MAGNGGQLIFHVFNRGLDDERTIPYFLKGHRSARLGLLLLLLLKLLLLLLMLLLLLLRHLKLSDSVLDLVLGILDACTNKCALLAHLTGLHWHTNAWVDLLHLRLGMGLRLLLKLSNAGIVEGGRLLVVLLVLGH